MQNVFIHRQHDYVCGKLDKNYHKMQSFPSDSVVNNLPTMQETQERKVHSLGQEDPLEESMATHSNILAWRSPWTEETGGLQSMGSQRVVNDWSHWVLTHAGLPQNATQTSEFSNTYLASVTGFLASRCKINIQNWPAFLYTSNDQLKIEVNNKNSPTKNSTKNLKYLGIKTSVVKTTKCCWEKLKT